MFLYLFPIITQESETILENYFILEADTGLFFPFNVERREVFTKTYVQTRLVCNSRKLERT